MMRQPPLIDPVTCALLVLGIAIGTLLSSPVNNGLSRLIERAIKERGAVNKLSTLGDEQRAAGVIAASAAAVIRAPARPLALSATSFCSLASQTNAKPASRGLKTASPSATRWTCQP